MTSQKRNLVVAFAAAIGFLTILSIFSFRSVNAFIESAESVNQTTQLTLELEKIKGTMSEVETAQRGYLLTHDSVFFRKFTKVLSEYPLQIAIVKQFSEDNPDQQNSFAQIERLAVNRAEYLKKILELEKTQTVTTDEYLISQALMDSMRSEVNTMVIRQNNLLDQQSNELLKKSLYAPFLLLLASLISLAIIIISYLKLNKALIQEHKLKGEGIRQSYELELAKEKHTSENKFQDLVEKAPVAITILRGKDLVVEIANKKQLQFWDKTKEETLNRPIFEHVPDYLNNNLLEMLNGVLSTGKPFISTEMPFKFVLNGIEQTFYVNFICEPLFKDQQIDGILAVSTDVTEQVMAKKKSEESEQRFQAAIEAVQGVLWTNSSVGEMEGEQIGWSSLTGQTYEEYQGFGWANSVHPDDKDATIEAWKLAVENSSIFIFEHRLKTKDGNYKNFSIRAIPLFNMDGSLRQWVGVHTDITFQKQQQVILRESESRYRSLADNTPVISFILEPDQYASVSYWNKTWLDYTGQTFEEALGRSWDGIIHPDDVQGVLKIYADAFEKLESFHLPGIRVKRHDGVYRWHLFTGNPRYLADGQFMGYIGIGFDIHDKKLAEEKLAYRTALLEAHNQASVDGILLVDARGKILSYNERFVEIWNMPQPIVAAKDDEAALVFAMSELVNPQQFIDKVKHSYAHPTEKSYDELEFKDGKIVERNGYPVIGRDGIYYAWSWTFKDVTRQKHIEKEIRDSEERFRLLAHTLPQLVWVTDTQGNTEFISIRWVEYSGVEPNSEAEWKAIVHPEDYERINTSWAYRLKIGTIYKSEVRLKNRNGEFRWFEVNGEPVFDQNKKILKWVRAFTDIHEQKLKDERKDEFLSLASHEMKTPLTIAKAYLQMLELTLDESDEEATLFAKKANQSVDTLTELVSELLDVSKIRLGKLQYTLSTFDFNALIDDTVESIQLTTTTHRIIKSGTIYDQVYGDKNRLQQVLINLLSNAIKYSPDEKEVFITIEQMGDTIQVWVKDAGIGIAQNSLVKIFDKYHRIEEHAVNFQGLGIGLFISFEIIQRHKGKLWAESEPGKGSVFHFTLPLNNSSSIKN